MHRWNVRDLIGGLLFAALGLFFLFGAMEFRFGSARSMGPGYFPTVLGVIALVLAGLLLARVPAQGAGLPTVSWRPMLAVLASIFAFALTIRWLGLAPAVVLAVLVSALGDRESRLLSTIVLAIVLAMAAWAIFRLGLGLPMPAFRELPSWMR